VLVREKDSDDFSSDSNSVPVK